MKVLDIMRVGGSKSVIAGFLLIFILSCDSTKSLLVNNDLYQKMNNKCGSIEIRANYGLGPWYNLNIYVDNDSDKTFISMDSLKIYWKGQSIQYTYSMKKFGGDVVSENVIDVNEKRFIGINIKKELVSYGDTLVIYTNDFLRCQSESILTEPLEVFLWAVKPKRFLKMQESN